MTVCYLFLSQNSRKLNNNDKSHNKTIKYGLKCGEKPNIWLHVNCSVGWAETAFFIQWFPLFITYFDRMNQKSKQINEITVKRETSSSKPYYLWQNPRINININENFINCKKTIERHLFKHIESHPFSEGIDRWSPNWLSWARLI